ncbi:type II toxin-antitoxin system PemK/MazF family toxin [Clostridium perfringens]|uniref:Type II toxin-antitoxin system PemK/MazF family toxin n=1 Tax=Clostridium perfringens TaxID=1502 RepID=A0A8H9R2I1_CLOPF|nr:type II toxin-antitoxin system PemK/MazF family toxin [Clostridium perfringens]HAT4309627.1 type II toxin-antitoxin system PemK/MazF family toxin [Clostridium perfringens]
MGRVRKDFYKGEVYRGDIFYADLGDIKSKFGSVQGGIRPVIVIQNDIGNRYGETFVVTSVTSQPKKEMPVHTKIIKECLEKPSTILLEQITTISRYQMREKIGKLNGYEIKDLNRALGISIGLS